MLGVLAQLFDNALRYRGWRVSRELIRFPQEKSGNFEVTCGNEVYLVTIMKIRDVCLPRDDTLPRPRSLASFAQTRLRENGC